MIKTCDDKLLSHTQKVGQIVKRLQSDIFFFNLKETELAGWYFIRLACLLSSSLFKIYLNYLSNSKVLKALNILLKQSVSIFLTGLAEVASDSQRTGAALRRPATLGFLLHHALASHAAQVAGGRRLDRHVQGLAAEPRRVRAGRRLRAVLDQAGGGRRLRWNTDGDRVSQRAGAGSDWGELNGDGHLTWSMRGSSWRSTSSVRACISRERSGRQLTPFLMTLSAVSGKG